MTIVFDFDKTLTYKDTLFGYFIYCANKKKAIFYVYLVIYIFVLVLAKFDYFSNEYVKSIGIKFFLKNLDIENLNKISREYSKKIRLSEIYYNDYLKYIKDKSINLFVISASFNEYLKYLFSEDNIIASSMKILNGRPLEINFNCYGTNKVNALKNMNIEKIDVFYTDSITDLPLVGMANKIYLVKKGKKIECNSTDDFLKKIK
jgi:phosphoserine phosphatase